MTRKRIAITLGVALGVMAAALVLAGVLHSGGTARAQGSIADKWVMDIVFDDASSYPLEGPELVPPNELTVDVSENVPVSVTSVDVNLGPAVPQDVEISFYVFVPQDCAARMYDQGGHFPFVTQTIDGNYNVGSSGTVFYPTEKILGPRWIDAHFQTAEVSLTEPVNIPQRYTGFYELHCYKPGDYVFNTCNRADVKAPDFDPVPDNNLRCEPLTVHVQGFADIKIVDWTAPSPQNAQLGAPFQITVGEAAHNNGPQLAWSDVTWTAQEPAGGQVSARWIAQPGDTQPSDEVLQFQRDLTMSITWGFYRGLELTCLQAGGPYTVTLINDEWPINPNPPHDPWEDPDPTNNTATTTVQVNCAKAGDVKWKQPPDETPIGLDVAASESFILADDFQCTESGMIKQIDFWGSWLFDRLPSDGAGAVQFTLSLHSDVPAGVDQPWSHPGETLWLHTFAAGECAAQPWTTVPFPGEGWFQPPGIYAPAADTQIWLYTCPIPTPDWFQQEKGKIYWLDVHAMSNDPGAFFGWKTSFQHWNDDGVWAQGAEPIPPLSWSELRYPPTHPLEGDSIDQAFQISGQPCPADVDTDLDGFDDNVECYLPTDSRDNCTNNPGVHDAWPLDIDMSRDIDVTSDVFSYTGRLGASGGQAGNPSCPPDTPMWWQRLDLQPDCSIDVTGDVFNYVGKIGMKCT